MADTAYKEEYTYQVGKITFIVTPVYKDEGEPILPKQIVFSAWSCCISLA